uniref:L-aminoadipate-semialdehyde dehydrogenase-phosphopantetheinyl transferase n=1 Tax=Syphacia muris TaxID=451379 RepID=A0A0N5AT27_9BILA
MELRPCKCHRLVVSLSSVLKSEHFELHFRKAVQCITEEELKKFQKFRYQEDALASLLGRLFLRQATKRLSGCEWKDIEFGRTAKGKPFLKNPPVQFGINVSHQGDYVAFASSCTPKVGVDCMRLDVERNNKSADEYINSMARSASPDELNMMRSQPTEAMKMAYFYRYWCLKEAILKATGEGLLSDLSRLDFRIDKKERYFRKCFITSTTVLLDGELQNQWVFEESFIDDKHVGAVCRERLLPRSCMFRQDPEARLHFGFVTIDFLLDGATVINPLPEDGAIEWEEFKAKLKKTF